jgi:hypothetical protein
MPTSTSLAPLAASVGLVAAALLIIELLLLHAWLLCLAVLLVCWAAGGSVSRLHAVASTFIRAAIAGAVFFGVGVVLGFCFPIGVRLIGKTGEWAVQKAWAINGAASVAGSAVAAVIGVSFGASVQLATAVVCYLLALLVGYRVVRLSAADSAAGQ